MNRFAEKLRTIARWNDPGSYQVVAPLFLRLLGVIYGCAFVSLWLQIRGLIGSNGILPVSDLMRDAAASLTGFSRWQLPTLCWFSSSDGWLLWQCGLGTFFSLLLIIGLVPRLCCILLWVLWLSLTVAGRDFLAFQWDSLLLEAGFLAIFLAPVAWRLSNRREPSRAALWLVRWLLFRLMFLSGIVKLLSGDPSWRDFTALFYHYETQPLPTVLGWFAFQQPHWALIFQTVLMYIIELALPFLIFAGRKPRMIACIGLVLLQLAIALTGNYCYFNYLTILLCLLLLDDQTVLRMIPPRWRKTDFPPDSTPKTEPETEKTLSNAALVLHRLRVGGFSIVAAVILIVSFAETTATCGLGMRWAAPIAPLYTAVAPFRSINVYGLFAVMTKTRPEIIVEGSNDGTDWKAYEFRYKPGDLKQRPKYVAPHQPRLDWQMWFAALSDYQRNPWFVNFCVRLLEGQPEVLALLASNPFPDKPPKFIRAVTYDYQFTDLRTLRKTGEWWRREYKGVYLHQASLNPAERGGSQPATPGIP